MADHHKTMNLTDALRNLRAREQEVFGMVRDIQQAWDVESSTFWTRTAESLFKQGFTAMNRALHHPHEDD